MPCVTNNPALEPRCRELTLAAFVISTIVTVLLTWAVVLYGRRISPDYKMTWGEAMIFSTVVFFIHFLAYGIVPHQWLTVAENEWSFRADILWDAWGLLTAKSQGGWFPFEITLRVISDSVAAIIYIVFLGAQIALWMQWQKRGEKAKKAPAVVSSTYGRPLVKRG